jgi:hemoglobin
MHNTDETASERRARITNDIRAQTGIDEAMIEALVRKFYARVRQDALLAPIFESRVADWSAHIEKLCVFWSSVALMTGRYHGQPMQAHADLPVDGEHFDRWLTLFEQTAIELCPPAAAAHFVERSRRIADSLEMGIATRQGRVHYPRRSDRQGGVTRLAGV